MSPIDNSDKLKLSIIDGLLDDIPNIEEAVFQRLLKLLDKFDSSGGNFTNSKESVQRLLGLQSEIEDILSKAGYFKKAGQYISDLQRITQNTIDLQKYVNGIDIKKPSLTGIEKLYADRALQTLSEGGLSVNFVAPVTTALQEAILYGYSTQTTRDNLEKSLLDTGNGEPIKGVRSLKSYLTTTARDTVSQLQGSQQQAIANEYDMKYIRYVGGLLEHSRGQCVRWKGMKYIEIANLQEEIDLAFKNQKRKLEEGGHKWGGMIPETKPQNFCEYRGGYACMHQAIPTLKKY